MHLGHLMDAMRGQKSMWSHRGDTEVTLGISLVGALVGIGRVVAVAVQVQAFHRLPDILHLLHMLDDL